MCNCCSIDSIQFRSFIFSLILLQVSTAISICRKGSSHSTTMEPKIRLQYKRSATYRSHCSWSCSSAAVSACPRCRICWSAKCSLSSKWFSVTCHLPQTHPKTPMKSSLITQCPFNSPGRESSLPALWLPSTMSSLLLPAKFTTN